MSKVATFNDLANRLEFAALSRWHSYPMIFRYLLAALSLILFQATAFAEGPRVELDTSMGKIVLQLDEERAPLTVANFLQYVDEGFYDGTVFHRVIDGFMVQGGGFTTDLQRKQPREPIQNEASNGLKNYRMTIAMARTNQPHSATAQFFINTEDNDFLNHKAPTPAGWGYAVFGKVISGAAVVEDISAVATGPRGPFSRDVPTTNVVINKAQRVTP